jgi:hypothetical protein
LAKIPARKFYIKNYVRNEKNFFDHRNSLKTYNPVLKNLDEYRRQRASLQIIPENRYGSVVNEENLTFVNEDDEENIYELSNNAYVT